MKFRTSHTSYVIIFILLFFLSDVAIAGETATVKLPDSKTDGGRPLMTVLKERKSSRKFSEKSLSPQTMSNLLWAAFGINRPDSGGRTAPSAHNRQEIDIYVVNAKGAFRYDAAENSLIPVLSQDIRKLAGKQAFVKTAPVNLVYVADYSKMGKGSSEEKTFYAAADTGFIGQNVYLFCTSEGLATVVRAWVDKEKLGKALKLKADQHIVLVQTVGYPETK